MDETPTTIPWDPNCTKFPTRKELPQIAGAPDGAAWVWGKDDYVGRLNLLTPTRVAAAAKEIRTGEIIPVKYYPQRAFFRALEQILPLDVPNQPAWNREVFKHEVKMLIDNLCYDDTYHLNTQSGTQWDGFRHFAHFPSGCFYNGTKGSDIAGPEANQKCSIHHWAERGIAGRGVLLDYRGYAQIKGIKYDPYEYHTISYEELRQCGIHQGIDIRPAAQGGDIKIGDILFIRSGWKEAYDKAIPEQRAKVGSRHGTEAGERFAGVAQEEKILDWLHDSYFAAVAGDAPSFEAWPTHEKYHLHEYILALWGMPLGEMLDLEKLARRCAETKRWFFFFTSAPANCPNGVGSHVNGTAIL